MISQYDLGKRAGSWRFVVAPPGQCNQFIVTFNGQAITTEAAKIKGFSFAPSCDPYIVWDAGTEGGKPLLKGTGSDSSGSAVTVWLVGETPPK